MIINTTKPNNYANELYEIFKSKNINDISSNELENFICICCEKGKLSDLKNIVDHLQTTEQDELIQYMNSKPFFLACQYNHLNIIKYLLKINNKTVCNAQKINGMLLACEYGHLDVVKFLISNNEKKDDNEKKIVYDFANVKYGVKEHLTKDIKLFTNDDYNKENIGFLLACTKEHFHVIDFLLNDKNINNANIQCLNGASFKIACKFSSLSTIKYLLTNPKLTTKYIIDNNDHNYFKFLHSIGQTKILKYLICDYQIALTPKIKSYIKNKDEIKKLFDIRDNFNHLNNSLPINSTPRTKIKI